MNILKVLTEKRIKGNAGENAVCKYLRKRHYKILERNFVAHGHEIDIIARFKNTICFVEVKSRSIDAKNQYDTRPRDAVDLEKKRSIITAAKAYTVTCDKKYRFRLDVAEVFLGDKNTILNVNYMENAFTLDDLRKNRF